MDGQLYTGQPRGKWQMLLKWVFFFGIFVYINYLSKLANKILLQILLANGAKKNLKNNDDKTAGEVTSDMAIKQLLTEEIPMEEKMIKALSSNPNLTLEDFVPNYFQILKMG